MNKKITDINRTYDYVEKCMTTELQYEDGSKKYLFIIPGEMIYVADCDYTELSKRIDAGDLDSFEAYDMTDGCSYYTASEYAEEISDALLWLTHKLEADVRFNALKNLVCWLTDHEQFKTEYIEEFGTTATKRLFGEHILNLLVEVGIDEQTASDVTDKLEEAFF